MTFVAAIEHSLVAKVVIANQMFFFSADRTGLSHFVFLGITMFCKNSTDCHIESLIVTPNGTASL